MRLIIFILILFTISFGGQLTPELQTIVDTFSPNIKTPVIAHLMEQGNLSIFPETTSNAVKIAYLRNIAESTQAPVLAYLNSVGDKAEEVKSFWLTNCIAFSATKDIIIAVARRADIHYVIDDFIIQLDIEEGQETTEWNFTKVKADSCWQFGYTGFGVVVGNMDTGVDTSHPALRME